jgi:hypothetical protein
MKLALIFNRIKSLFSKNTRRVPEIKSTEITRTKIDNNNIHRLRINQFTKNLLENMKTALEADYMKVKEYSSKINLEHLQHKAILDLLKAISTNIDQVNKEIKLRNGCFHDGVTLIEEDLSLVKYNLKILKE